MTASSDSQTQDLLEAITAGIQKGETTEAAFGQPGASAAGMQGYAELVQALQSILTPVEPRSEFGRQLHAELLDQQQGVVERVRQMPARVHIAAILALIAGCLLFLTRRLFGSETAPEMQEEAVATSL